MAKNKSKLAERKKRGKRDLNSDIIFETKKTDVKPEKKNFWKCQLNAFASSFSNILRKEFIKSAVFDLLTIISIILIINLTLLLINRVSAPALPQLMEIYSLNQQGNTDAVNDAVLNYAPVLSRVLWLSLLFGVLGLLLATLSVSWFYGKAWSYAKNKMLTSKYLMKHFVMNLSWFIFWFIILLIILNAFVTKVAAIIFLLSSILLFYTDPVLRAVFDENKKIGQNIKEFLKVARKFHWFIFFLLTGFIILMIMLLILNLLIGMPALLAASFIIFALIYLGWARNYIIALVNKIN